MGEPAGRQVGSRRATALRGGRAGFVSRFVANVVDACILGLVGLLVLLVASLVRYLWLDQRFEVGQLPAWLTILAGLLVELAYLAYFWSTTGRTPGKQLMGLRVVDLAEKRLAGRRAVVRAAFCVVFPAGFLWVLVSRRNASLQDLVVRSQVIYDWTYRHV